MKVPRHGGGGGAGTRVNLLSGTCQDPSPLACNHTVCQGNSKLVNSTHIVDSRALLLLLLLLLQFCRPKGIPVIINDRVDVALAAGRCVLAPSQLAAAARRPLALALELVRHSASHSMHCESHSMHNHNSVQPSRPAC
jgi:hypothetical protein